MEGRLPHPPNVSIVALRGFLQGTHHTPHPQRSYYCQYRQSRFGCVGFTGTKLCLRRVDLRELEYGVWSLG